MKKALITGITGQDGSYLAELLLKKNYHVVGLVRHSTKQLPAYLNHCSSHIQLIQGDLGNESALHHAIETCQPDEIYNLAAQSHPNYSWQNAIATMEITGMGAHRLFEAVKKLAPSTRVYQASSSEIFGNPNDSPQTENTALNPLNPYAASKVYAHHMANLYRREHGLLISCGILFNHESPRRGLHFVTQKITYAAACLNMGIKNSSQTNEKGAPIVADGKLSLGNLDTKRDWGFAGDYVEAMWLMLQHQADDFVIGTGQAQSIRDVCHIAFSHVNLNWEDHVITDSQLTRAVDTKQTLANPAKANRILNWHAKKPFKDMITSMVDAHLASIKQ